MTLTLTLTDTEYVAVMHALRQASQYKSLYILNEAEKLELEHLRALLTKAQLRNLIATDTA